MLIILCFLILNVFINILNIYKTIKSKDTNSFIYNLSIPTFALIIQTIITFICSKVFNNIESTYIQISLVLYVIVCSFFTFVQAILVSIKCIIYKQLKYLFILAAIILLCIIAPAINIICIPIVYFANLLFKKFFVKNKQSHTYSYSTF